MEPEKSSLIPCLISAMVIVAIHDGRLSQREKELIIQLVTASLRRSKTPSEILATVETHVSGFHAMGRPLWKEMMESGRNLSDPKKRMVVEAATKMAFAAGRPDREVLGLLGRIAFWIGLEGHELDSWRRELRELMETPGAGVGWDLAGS
jgi:tellurite resistance protein